MVILRLWACIVSYSLQESVYYKVKINVIGHHLLTLWQTAHPQVSSTVRHIQLSSSCTLQNERALAQMPQVLDLFFGNLNCVVNNNETSGYN